MEIEQFLDKHWDMWDKTDSAEFDELTNSFSVLFPEIIVPCKLYKSTMLGGAVVRNVVYAIGWCAMWDCICMPDYEVRALCDCICGWAVFVLLLKFFSYRVKSAQSTAKVVYEIFQPFVPLIAGCVTAALLASLDLQSLGVRRKELRSNLYCALVIGSVVSICCLGITHVLVKYSCIRDAMPFMKYL